MLLTVCRIPHLGVVSQLLLWYWVGGDGASVELLFRLYGALADTRAAMKVAGAIQQHPLKGILEVVDIIKPAGSS